MTSTPPIEPRAPEPRVLSPPGHRRSSTLNSDPLFSPFSTEQDHFNRSGDARSAAPAASPAAAAAASPAVELGVKSGATPNVVVTESKEPSYKPSLAAQFSVLTTTVLFTLKQRSYASWNSLSELRNAPENIVRFVRRANVPRRALPAVTGTTPPPSKKHLFIGVCFLLFLLVWMAANGGFVAWTYFVTKVFLEPHKYRHSIIGDTRSHWWNFVGSFPIYGGCFIVANCVGFGFIWMMTLEMIKGKQTVYYLSRNRKFWHDIVSHPCLTVPLLLIFTFWTLIVPLVAPPTARKAAFGGQCQGWDYSVLLNGRVDANNLTRGRITITDRLHGGAQLIYETTDFVNITFKENAGTTILSLVSINDAFVPSPIITSVTYNFPYLETNEELAGWASNSDTPRTKLGNYTTVSNSSSVISHTGSFPYLSDSGLRLDEMGLVPDYPTSWRSRVQGAGLCQDGPDAYLLDNVDATARDVVGDKDQVILTGMTKFGSCCQSSVCANRRKQVVSGTPWDDVDGLETGKEVLDQLLVVPLGLLLVEQIKWGSCCGDGWQAFP